MNILLIYIIKIIISSGLPYGYYCLFLRNKRFHHYNRFYLLLLSAVSILLPFINIPLHWLSGSDQHPAVFKTLQVVSFNNWEELATINTVGNNWRHWLTLQNGLYVLYTTGVATGLFMLTRSLVYISRIKNKYPFEIFNKTYFFQTSEKGAPFSFFRNIFWNEKIPLDTIGGQQIFRHELFHVNQRHSIDILFMELLCIIGWFNPFFHLIKKETRAIHEFLADEYAASSGNKFEYAELLLTYAIRQRTAGLTHPFFHHQIKRRIAMITKLDQLRRNSGYISRAMVLPLLLIIFCAFAVKLTRSNAAVQHSAADVPITIVVDAGHGGIDAGAKGASGIAEKDITLAITQKMFELAPQYNVKVVLTRNNDILPGNATTIQEGLHKRVEISEQAKPDAFISIHVNTREEQTTSNSGFDAWVSGRKEDERSKKLASTILGGLKNIYAVSDNIHQSPRGIWVLDNSNCPAVIIECGYIDNPADAAFITDKNNQEKIAKNILDAVVQFKNHQFAIAAGLIPGTGYNNTTPGIASLEKNLNGRTTKNIKVFKRDKDVLITYNNGDSTVIKNEEIKYYVQEKNRDPKVKKQVVSKEDN